jgi:D-tyrosyl-tRNA(Tyr) deacylase
VIALLQRVSEAEVDVDGERVARIAAGLLVLVGVERHDDSGSAARLAERLVGYRVFPDEAQRMNRSVRDVGGELLLVPQFTLAADTRKGTRASFSTAAEPAIGERLFDAFVAHCRERVTRVATGRFGAHMRVSSTNDGPVTFWLQVTPSSPPK